DPIVTDGIPKGMHSPSVIDEQEINAVTKMLKSQNLFRFSDNSEVLKFEQEAAELLGMKHSLMVNSGTSAIICTLTDGGIGPGDKVIFPRYTFIATAAAVVAVGAIPVIAEIDDSLGLDPIDVERKITPYTKAVLPVHMQGVSGRIDQIVDVANRHDLQIFEDCCQCIGGRYRGRFVGTIGNAGAWSLNFFKIISTGEGGSIFTDDYEIYERSAFDSDPAMPMRVKDGAKYMQVENTWMTTPSSRPCYRPSGDHGCNGTDPTIEDITNPNSDEETETHISVGIDSRYRVSTSAR
ncbi:MAG: aminotransferase class I/II-fold pyridoxal phosphate-dependent enzyme, partial [Candidatus Poribacteria bacterium]|nr:aminotransferase class I/II-fold pyridoxal phosphate-dependent enzyme [Candidatus Poribacteria bacterium]